LGSFFLKKREVLENAHINANLKEEQIWAKIENWVN
jgi:hypothetical protein